MQYMLLIYEDEGVYGSDRDGAAMAEMVPRHMAFSRDVGAALAGGAGMKGTSSATTVRSGNGVQAIHDGPFAETKEQLGGYYVIDVPDLDAAIAIAKKIPLKADGAVEIRPLFAGG